MELFLEDSFCHSAHQSQRASTTGSEKASEDALGAAVQGQSQNDTPPFTESGDQDPGSVEEQGQPGSSLGRQPGIGGVDAEGVAKDLKAEMLEMTQDMLELYTVLNSTFEDRSLRFFRETSFGSGMRPLEESNTQFVNDLSQSATAVSLTLLRSAVKALTNGLEVTPIGQSFKLLDTRDDHQRWIVQLPSNPRVLKLPDPESPSPIEPPAEGVVSQLSASRCTYAMMNFDATKAAGLEEEDANAVSDPAAGFLRGVVLMGDLQLAKNKLPRDVSVGICNASHFGDQFQDWP